MSFFLRNRFQLLAASLLLAVVLVYMPGIYGGFYFDDYPNIVQNRGLSMDAFTWEELLRASYSSSAGPLRRPVAMATLALNYHFSALAPLPYKVTNIAIHGINAGLLLALLLLLNQSIFRPTGDQNKLRIQGWSIALLATALWVLHPINVSSVLYVVQRMTSLSATFSLLALICYVHARLRLHLHWRWPAIAALGLVGFGTLAILSKETALILPVLVLVLEFTVFESKTETPRYWRILMRAALASVLLFAIYWAIQHLVLNNWAHYAFVRRPFTLTERALSEARIVWQYWDFILLPNIQEMGLYLDDVVVSKSIFNPWTTFPALVGHALLIGCGIFLRKRQPVAAFGILWFYTGHILESTIYPLELMYEHRNYLPMMGPLYAVSYYAVTGLERMSLRLQPIAKIAALLLVVILASGTLVRAQHFGNAWTFPFGEAENHPNSARANFFAGRICAELALNQQSARKKNLDCAFKYLQRSTATSAFAAEPLIVMAQTMLAADIPIPATLLDELESRLAIQPLGNHGVFLAKGLLEMAAAKSPIPISRTERLFTAAIHNTRISTDSRAHMLVSKGIWLCEIRQECASSIMEFENAAAVEPTTQFFVILATYQLRLKRIEEAMRSLQEAEQKDSRRLFKKTIIDLRRHAVTHMGKP